MNSCSHTLAKLIGKYGGLIQTGPFGSQLHQHEYVGSGIPVVMPKDIVGGRIDESTIAMVSENKANTLARHRLNQGDIVFPRRGDIRKCTLIDKNQEGYLCGTGCLKITLPKHVYSPHFLYYYLILPKVGEWLERNAVGTTMLNLNTSILGNVPIPDKSIKEQDKIASTLSAYDDLIENNRRRIQLLEESARMLYKEWFVRLRFPGHEHVKVVDGLPEGWEKKQIKDLLSKVKRPGKIKKTEYLKEAPIPCIDQSQNFIGGYTDQQDTVISTIPMIVFGDHTRILKYVNFPFSCGADGTQLLISKDQNISQEFFFYALDSIDLSNYFYARHFKFLKDQYIPRPTDTLINQFTQFTRPLLEQVTTLRQNNTELAKARDLLLPRLMNGEVAV